MSFAHVIARAGIVTSMCLMACQPSTSTSGDERSTATQVRLDTTLVAGRRFNCQLGPTGDVRCWGNDRPLAYEPSTLDESMEGSTQLVIGSSQSPYDHTPEPICALFSHGEIACNRPSPIMGPASHVALGAGQGCALLERGDIQCWRLDGESASSHHEVPGAVALAVADTHACALTQRGRVECWGFEDCPPRHIAGLGVGVDISARVDTCVVDVHGVVRCLEPTRCPDPATSVTWTPKIAGARRVATGYEVNCASSASTVTCWPSSVASTETPRLARSIELPESIRELAVGAEHACVRTEAGTIECWGSNRDHQLDHDPVSTLVADPRVVTGIERAERVVVGTHRSCARSVGGIVSCWGEAWDSDDPLPWTGEPRIVPRVERAVLIAAQGHIEFWRPEPNSMFGPVLDEVASRGGWLHVERVSLDDRSQLWCVSTDAGAPSCAISPQPSVAATALPGRVLDGARDIALCIDRAWIVDSKGRLSYVWLYAELSDRQPARVELPGAVADVTCASYEVCVRLEDGSVSCWSDTRSSDPLYSEQPGSIPLEAPARGLTMGLRTACSWSAEGRAECWGDPSAPSLTPLLHPSRRSPGTLTSIRDVTQVAIAYSHGCAVHFGGTVSCWGTNIEGQAGLGSGAWRPKPAERPPPKAALTPAAAAGSAR